MANVTKADLVKTVARRLRMSQPECALVVDAFLEAIKETLFEQQRIELRRFGSFETRVKGPRIAVNPNTGEKIEVPAHVVVVFRPANVIRKLPLKR